MRIAITGSGGFIGVATEKAAVAAGHEIVRLDRRHGHDILDGPSNVKKLKGCDSVIHLAGVLGTAELFDTIDEAIEVNIKGTTRILEAAVENELGYVGITMPPVFHSIYTATKVAAGRIADAFHHTYGLPVTHIKAFNAYGPGQAVGPGHPQKIIPTFADRSWRGLPIPIWGDGQQTVDLVHVDDLAQHLLLAAVYSKDDDGYSRYGSQFGHCETWDSGSGYEMTVLDVAHAVSKVTGCGLVEFLPMRSGEPEGTKLRATEFGPLHPSRMTDERFEAVVKWYRPKESKLP